MVLRSNSGQRRRWLDNHGERIVEGKEGRSEWDVVWGRLLTCARSSARTLTLQGTSGHLLTLTIALTCGTDQDLNLCRWCCEQGL